MTKTKYPKGCNINTKLIYDMLDCYSWAIALEIQNIVEEDSSFYWSEATAIEIEKAIVEAWGLWVINKRNQGVR